MIALSGLVGGLLTGFGIVFFVLPGAAQPSAGSNGTPTAASGNGSTTRDLPPRRPTLGQTSVAKTRVGGNLLSQR